MGLMFRRQASKWTVGEVTTLHQVIYGVISICVVIIFSVALWYVTRLPFFTIGEIQVEGGETIPHEDVRSAAENALYGNYFFLIPHRFVYLYPNQKIRSAVEEIPRAHTVSVERDGRTTLKITFEEYVPYSLWCLSTEDSAPCYFIDSTGYAFTSAPPLRGGALTRHIIEGRDNLEEMQIFSSFELQSMEAFMSGIESGLGLRVTMVTHSNDGDIIYHINGGGDLLTAKDDDVSVLYQNLKSIFESKEFKHLEPGNFKYVDLRFGNKLFVNEDLTTVAIATTSTSTSQ